MSSEAQVPAYVPARSRLMRWALFGLGWGFVVLGVVGILLPLLPTTPFLLLALWAFSQSSRRFQRWLYHHRWFGPPLQRWHTDRLVPLRVKWVAWAGMSGGLLVLMWRGPPWWVLLPAAAFVGFGAGFVYGCPSRAPPLPETP